LVAAELCDEALVQIAYAIGVTQPVSIDVSTNGTGRLPDAALCEMVEEHFDLSPAAIIQRLDLLKPRYQKTAAYGHFGRPDFPWEELTHVQALKRDAAEAAS
jgi:S-adenosylmethionine synthetase